MRPRTRCRAWLPHGTRPPVVTLPGRSGDACRPAAHHAAAAPRATPCRGRPGRSRRRDRQFPVFVHPVYQLELRLRRADSESGSAGGAPASIPVRRLGGAAKAVRRRVRVAAAARRQSPFLESSESDRRGPLWAFSVFGSLQSFWSSTEGRFISPFSEDSDGGRRRDAGPGSSTSQTSVAT